MKKIILWVFLLFFFVFQLKAQDTIDSTYYRYDNNFLEISNPMCPNGEPFTRGVGSCDISFHWEINSSHLIDDCPEVRRTEYMYYQLSETKQDVYGIAIPLDSIANFTEGDSMMVILCDANSSHTLMLHLDTIVIKGGETGKRRWMETPIHYDYFFFDVQETPRDNCVDTVLYRQFLEFYFDRPSQISGKCLWFKIEVFNNNGSVFYFSVVRDWGRAWLDFYDRNCQTCLGYRSWYHAFPILTPLPEWEEPSVEQLIPMPRVVEHPEQPEYHGIGDADKMSSFALFPNPTNGTVSITATEPISEISVSDMTGRTVIRHNACGTDTVIDTDSLRSGLYLVRIKTEKGSVVKKLVVE